MKKLGNVDYNNPIINDVKVKQLNLQNQVVFIKDSLYALSKRAPEISSIINKEMLDLLHFDNFTFSEDDPIIASPFRDNSQILDIIPI